MMLMTSYGLEEYARTHTELRRAEAEQERLVALAQPNRGGGPLRAALELWRGVRQADRR